MGLEEIHCPVDNFCSEETLARKKFPSKENTTPGKKILKTAKIIKKRQQH